MLDEHVKAHKLAAEKCFSTAMECSPERKSVSSRLVVSTRHCVNDLFPWTRSRDFWSAGYADGHRLRVHLIFSVSLYRTAGRRRVVHLLSCLGTDFLNHAR